MVNGQTPEDGQSRALHRWGNRVNLLIEVLVKNHYLNGITVSRFLFCDIFRLTLVNTKKN